MEFELSITPNDYEPLWIDHCDPDVLISAFDLDMHEYEDSRVPCSGFPGSPNPATFPLYKSQRSALTLVQSQAHICSTSSMIFLRKHSTPTKKTHSSEWPPNLHYSHGHFFNNHTTLFPTYRPVLILSTGHTALHFPPYSLASQPSEIPLLTPTSFTRSKKKPFQRHDILCTWLRGISSSSSQHPTSISTP